MPRNPARMNDRAPSDGQPGPCTVKVLGTRLGRYVEFEFSLNDPDLTVELVMPFAAFDAFRAANGAVLLESDGADRLPGLYSPASDRDQPDDGAET